LRGVAVGGLVDRKPQVIADACDLRRATGAIIDDRRGDRVEAPFDEGAQLGETRRLRLVRELPLRG
jgi:hypothetical protein